ncbi:MAG: N-acetyl-gamma-glutamyl-phosphate reductase [Deltaproteobacteria bacterium]|nr:N-acetyl-gamma-glutamyl-phosphate reductase [Deltaproteobacteria bacterium]
MANKRWKAAVVGGSGYGGAEIIRRLLQHPEVELVRVVAADHIGEPLGAVHLSLTGRTPLRFESMGPAEAAAGVDVVLLGLPHKVSAKLAPELIEAGVGIVDMSGDFRLRNAALYEEFYGAPHPHPELLGTFDYGLPELNRAAIKRSRRVASPGCFATCIELALLPLANTDWLGGPVHVQGITGSSGSGIAPSQGTHHPTRAVNLKSYKPLWHQHTPEIQQTLADAGVPELQLRFVPVSAPLPRGILVTAFIEVPAHVTHEEVSALFSARYNNEPFVRYVQDRLPEVAAVGNSNFAEVGFTLGKAAGASKTLCVQSALDNLIKGGAGQAVQNMNLMLGLPETMSLEDAGPWP